MGIITGTEIDMIVRDCKGALALYESIFEVERVEVTDFAVGSNEAVFTIYGVRFHMLDENEEYHMVGPQPGQPLPVWFNIAVPDIRAVWQKAMDGGCTEIQPINEMEDFGVINAMFADPYGYTWMLHEIVRVVSFEEREKMFKDKM